MTQPQDKKQEHQLRLLILLAAVIGFVSLWKTSLGHVLPRAMGF
jgi:hypothetical protein